MTLKITKEQPTKESTNAFQMSSCIHRRNECPHEMHFRAYYIETQCHDKTSFSLRKEMYSKKLPVSVLFKLNSPIGQNLTFVNSFQ